MKTKKQYNTSEYRGQRRLVAFVDPTLKQLVTRTAKKEDKSVSSFLGDIISAWANG